MRIAHVCQSYPPMISGAALVAQRLADRQAAAGHTVLVLAASPTGPAGRTSTRNLTHHWLPAIPNPFRIGQRFVLHPGGALAAAMRAFTPDVVHLHDPLLIGRPALRAARALGLPAVLTIQALPEVAGAYVPRLVRRPLQAALWAYARAFVAQCAALVAPSAAVAATVQQQTGRWPLVISNGVDLKTFTPEPAAGEAAQLRRRYGLPAGPPLILTVSRLDLDKRTDVIIRALGRLETEGAHAPHLLVVGDGTQRAHLTALAAQQGVGERVHFAGYISPLGDLPGLYRLASVFALASETETEGIVVNEAAASGLPVVAVRATSMPDLIAQGRTGWLVRPRDADDMAARCRRHGRAPGRLAGPAGAGARHGASGPRAGGPDLQLRADQRGVRASLSAVGASRGARGRGWVGGTPGWTALLG